MTSLEAGGGLSDYLIMNMPLIMIPSFIDNDALQS